MSIWKITGYEGLDEIFSRSIPDMTETEVEVILQRLAARHLSEVEVISASLRKGMKGRSTLLEITRTGGRNFGLMTTGTDFHYTASYESA